MSRGHYVLPIDCKVRVEIICPAEGAGPRGVRTSPWDLN